MICHPPCCNGCPNCIHHAHDTHDGELLQMVETIEAARQKAALRAAHKKWTTAAQTAVSVCIAPTDPPGGLHLWAYFAGTKDEGTWI